MFESLELLDPFPVRNEMIGEAGTISKNLIDDLVREGVEIALSVLGQIDLDCHAVRALVRRRVAL
jgi:hypothetical protein